jgi:hypothetical protein
MLQKKVAHGISNIVRDLSMTLVLATSLPSGEEDYDVQSINDCDWVSIVS